MSRSPCNRHAPGRNRIAAGAVARIRHPGFTIIELMVSIAIILLLIAAITAVASTAIRQQRISNTRQTMQNLEMAVSMFQTVDPLRGVYGDDSFGGFPPYQLLRPTGTLPIGNPTPQYVGIATEGSLRTLMRNADYTLSQRLYADLSGASMGIAPNSWVNDDFKSLQGRGDDDNLALYTYLRLWNEESIKLIPPGAVKPLSPARKPAVNPSGSGPAYGTAGNTWVDTLAIHDAWGVPLDYMLAVKLEWSSARGAFVVTERKPLFRSRGVERAIYDAAVKRANGGVVQTEPTSWIFSGELPRPWVKFAALNDPVAARNGRLNTSLNPFYSANGWARAVADHEDYFFTPEQDPPPAP